MPSPKLRVPLQFVRGTYANLLSSIQDLVEGELCYGRDTNALYIKQDDELIQITAPPEGDLAAYIREVTGQDQTNEPMGFVDRTKSHIAFNSSTRTLSISPTNSVYTVWCKGIKVNYVSEESVQIPDQTGLYYIFFESSGNLQYQLDFFDWANHVPVAYVYWNSLDSSLVYLGDERHGIVLDWQTHEYLHRTRGASLANGFDISGFTTTGDGSLDSHAQFSLSNGTFFDEDLQVDITHSENPAPDTWQQFLVGPCKPALLYRQASSWKIDTPSSFALKFGTALPVYNTQVSGSWTTVDSSSNKYLITFLIATNNLIYPVIGIVGQGVYSNSSEALSIEFRDIDLTGFPSREFRPLFKLVYQVGNYANNIKARLRSIQDLRYTGIGQSAQEVITNHSQLNGLDSDDHPQYLHLSIPRTISASHSFTGDISFTRTQIDNFIGDVNLETGNTYKINNVTVLSQTGLGSSVQISSANIPDSLITNQHIESGAGILGTKITPDFGDQNIRTTGNVFGNTFIGSGASLTNLPTTNVYQHIEAVVTVNAGQTVLWDLNLPKSFLLYKVQLEKACWFRLYNSALAATNDVARLVTVDPQPASGVVCEIITSQYQSLWLTPIPIATNAESPRSNLYKIRLRNDDVSNNVSIRLEYLTLES